MSRHQCLTRLLLVLLLTVSVRGVAVNAAGVFNSPRGTYHRITGPSRERNRVDVKLVAQQSQTGGRIEPPNPPIIFLHYDYMAARSWDPSAGNFAPDPAAIE